jgi:hypothetical protein
VNGTRAPKPGEKCSCGGDPIIVYVTDTKDVPYCGVPGGSAPAAPKGGVR